MIGKVEFLLRETGNLFAISLEGLRRTPDVRHWWKEYLRQCWFIAKVTSIPVILISIPFGAVIALHVGAFSRQLGAESTTGAAMVLAIVREAAPVATALLIAGAGGSAMTADLGSRKVRDEIAAMEVLAVDPVHRLIVPRILALPNSNANPRSVAFAGGSAYLANQLRIRTAFALARSASEIAWEGNRVFSHRSSRTRSNASRVRSTVPRSHASMIECTSLPTHAW